MSGTNPQIPGYYTGRPENSSEQATTAAVEQKDGNQQPQGVGSVYYVGRPVNAGAERPPAAPEQEDMTPPDPPGYYKGRPVKSVRPVESEKQPADGPSKAEPSFFAKCFVCFSSSGNA